MHRSSWLALALASLLAAPAWALPAAPFPIELHNADGTTVKGRLLGDEFMSWGEDLDGWPLAYDREHGAWHYATLGPQGRLVPLPVRAESADPRTLGLVQHLRPTAEAARQAIAERLRQHGASPRMVPARGNVPNLAFLVKFNCAGGACDPATSTTSYTPTDFNAVFNGASGSVRHYYSEVSYGQLNLTTTIADNAWIQLPYDDDFYVYNDAVGFQNTHLMIRHAVQALDTKATNAGTRCPGSSTRYGFDFGSYDTDKDGVIDAVDVIHVGPGYEFSGNTHTIHSHFLNLMEIGMEFQSSCGTWFTAYHTEPELRYGGGITMIGAIVHETAHFFGAPDLYDTTGASQGVGMWSLMASGSWAGPSMDGTLPVHPDAWTKFKLGFITPTTVSASSAQTVKPAHTTASVLKLAAGMPSTQYFLAENRQRASYDYYLPGSGLAIYHVDTTQEDNTNPNRYLVDVEQCDGKRSLNVTSGQSSDPSDAADLFPCNHANFSATTNPSSLAYGATTSQITVDSIRRSGTDVLLNVVIGSGNQALGTACTSGLQCQSTFCVDGVCCDALCDKGECDACSLAAGSTQAGRCQLLTRACNDNNPCTLNDQCSAGKCGGTPKTCPAETACTLAGTCNLLNGACDVANKPNGTACNDGQACTTGEKCQAGVCGGGATVTCPAPDACHAAGTCNASTGTCTTFPNAPDGTACDDKNPCTSGDTCRAGTCTAGAAVNSCPAPDACKLASTCNAGTGLCNPFPNAPDGTACDDKNPCTTNDTCRAGTCTGGAVTTTCPAVDACHEPGTCNPATGGCTAGKARADGTACDDGDLCTASDTCLAGVCKAGTRTTCSAPDACHDASSCDPKTGRCSSAYPAKADGTACDDKNACTTSDACQAGTCKGTPSGAACPADQCHEAGTCNATTGLCSGANKPNGTACNDGDATTTNDVCTNGLCKGTVPNVDFCWGKATGTDCNDKNPCTRNDFCKDNVCLGTNPLPCPAPDDCHVEGSCDWQTGECVFPAAANGTACDDGRATTTNDRCSNGRCLGEGKPTTECTGKSDGTACSTGTCQGGTCTAPPTTVEQKGCGCGTGGAPSAWLGLVFLGLALRRRTSRTSASLGQRSAS